MKENLAEATERNTWLSGVNAFSDRKLMQMPCGSRGLTQHIEGKELRYMWLEHNRKSIFTLNSCFQ